MADRDLRPWAPSVPRHAGLSLLGACWWLALLALPAAAQLDPPNGIQTVAGCQQYVVTWNAVSGAAAYHVYVDSSPTPITVTDELVVIPATSAPTDHSFRIATVDDQDVEGPRSGTRQASGAELPFTLTGMPDITVHVGLPFTVTVALTPAPNSPSPSVTYDWYHDGVSTVSSGPNVHHSTAQLSDAGLYSVRGCSLCCDSVLIARVIVIPNALQPPANVQAQNGCQSATVTWNAVSGAVAYVVHRTGASDVTVTASPYVDPLATGVCRRYSVSTVDSYAQEGSDSQQTPQLCGSAPLASGLSLGADQVIATGTRDTLKLTGVFDAAGSTFEWRKDGALIGAASQSTYVLPNASLAQSGAYTCKVCNACGCVTSPAMNLLVVTPPAPPATITEVASCNTIAVDWTAVPGVTTYSVRRIPVWHTPPTNRTITGTSYVDHDFANQTGPYVYEIRSVIYGNILGSPNYSDPPAIYPGVPPTTQQLNPGRTVEAGTAFGLTGYYKPSDAVVTWRRNGVAIGTGQLNTSLNNWSTSTIFILNSTISDAGSYDLQVCTSCGCTTTNAAVMVVCQTPQVTVASENLNVFASEGDASVSLVATATNGGTLKWYRDGNALNDGSHYSGTSTATLAITTPLAADAGYYELRAAGNCSTVIGPSIHLTIALCYDPPVITQQPPVSQTVVLGGPATLSMTASCCRPLSYQWERFLPSGALAAVPGATSATLTIPAVSDADLGSYLCIALNPNVSRYAISSFSELKAFAIPHFTRITTRAACGGALVYWWTDVPTTVTPYVLDGRCGAPGATALAPQGLASSGVFLIPASSTAPQTIYLEARDEVNQLVTSGCMTVWASPPVPRLFTSVSVEPAYVTMPFGNAIAVQVSVGNNGCVAFDGDITLSSLELAGAGSALTATGEPATPLVLSPAQVAPGQYRSFPLLYFPITPPLPGVTVTRVLSGVIDYQAIGAAGPSNIGVSARVSVDAGGAQ